MLKPLQTKMVLCCTFFLMTLGAFAVPNISNVTASSTSVPKYETFELTFDLGQSYTNPYDPSEIDVYAEFLSPSGQTIKVNAFYYEGYTPSYSASSDPRYQFEDFVANPSGDTWMIRFTPDEIGNWQYRLKATDQTGTNLFPIFTFMTRFGPVSIWTYRNFTCTDSNNKGFIRLANSRYLAHETGESFFPIGPNLAWYGSEGWRSGNEYGTTYYQHLMDDLAASGANWIRIWVDYNEGIGLTARDFQNNVLYYEKFNAKDSWQVDWILNYARQKNIYVQFCVWSHGNLGNDLYANDFWDLHNPNNTALGGTVSNPYNWFADATALQIQENLLRYCVARWGHHTNVMAWELFNEEDHLAPFNVGVSRPASHTNDLINWNINHANFIRSVDPYNHPITTSFTGDVNGSPALAGSFSNLDIVQSHFYWGANTHSPQALNNKTQDFLSAFNKPFLIGETSHESLDNIVFGNNDPHGYGIHCDLWSSMFAGSMGPASFWDWTKVEDFDLYDNYEGIGAFAANMPVLSDNFQPVMDLYSNNLRTHYLHEPNSDSIFGWTQDVHYGYLNLRNFYPTYLQTLNPANAPNIVGTLPSDKIHIQINQRGFYKVEWYNTTTGQLHSTQSLFAPHHGAFIFPEIPQDLRYNSTYGDGAFIITWDCDKNLWFHGILNPTSPQTVSHSVAAAADGQIFYRASNGRIESMYYANGTWNWSALNNASGTNVAGDIVVGEYNQVFYRTTDNRINSLYYSGGSWHWSGLNNASGNQVAGNIVVGAGNQVFYRTFNNKLHSIYFSGGSWHWSELNATGNNVAGDIAVTPYNQVFYRTTDNRVQSLYYSGGAWHWSGLNNASGNNVKGPVAVGDNGQVFYRTTANQINSIYYSGGSWYWSQLNASSGNNVSNSIVVGNGNQVFYKTTTGAIHSLWYNSGVWNLSPLDYAEPGAVVGNLAIDDLNKVYYKRSDNRAHHIFFANQCYNINKNSDHTLPEKFEYLEYAQKSEESDVKQQVSLFPNPANDLVYISINQETEGFDFIRVISMSGRIVKDMSLKDKSYKTALDLQELPQGIFMVQIIRDGELLTTERLVVTH